MNKHRSVEKKLKKHSSTTDSTGHNDANLATKDAEGNWMNAVMTASFLTASMKSANEHSHTDHDSRTDSESADAAGHGDAFDGGDS